MFSDVEERGDETGLAIDSDSILFLSCYKYREDFNIELAYMEFCKRIGAIERACYEEVVGLTEIVLCFTAKKNFRHQIYDAYKANRQQNVDEDSRLLREHTKQLKMLCVERLRGIVSVSNKVEADDWVIDYSRKGYILAAIDSDVKNQSLTKVFDYKKNIWFEGLTEKEINHNILLYAMIGKSKDGVKGIRLFGKVKATKFMEELVDGTKTMVEYVDMFETPEDCLLNCRLVSLGQWKDEKLELMSMEDVFELGNSLLPF